MRVDYPQLAQFIQRHFGETFLEYVTDFGKRKILLSVTSRCVVFKDGHNVVKLRMAAEDIEKEAAVLKILSCASIKVQKVISFESAAFKGITVFKLILEYIPGRILSTALKNLSDEDLSNVVADIKAFRSEIKQLASTITLVADEKYYSDRIDSRNSYYKLLNQQELDSIKQNVGKMVAQHKQGFYHNDISPDNIVIGEDNRFTALIDWESASYMSPCYELSMLKRGKILSHCLTEEEKHMDTEIEDLIFDLSKSDKSALVVKILNRVSNNLPGEISMITSSNIPKN